MYNSNFNSIQDDPDLTMINPSLLFTDNNDDVNTLIPIVRRAQQANNPTTKPSQPKNDQRKHTTSDSRQDYMFVDCDRQETAKQIEQILNYYRQDLKQATYTQLDCDRYLVTRLVDFVRPACSSDQKKINDLDALLQEIGALHDKRHVEQQEKNEQLQHEIRHFKKLIITAPDEDENRYSTMTNVYRMNSMVDYEEWMEVEEETKRLYNLIELQRNQIEELIEYTSQEDSLTKSSKETADHGTQTERRSTIVDLSPPISRQSSSNFPDRCPVGRYTFGTTDNDHENRPCSSDTDSRHVSIYQCPKCERKFPGDAELDYHQHLSFCYNEAAEF